MPVFSFCRGDRTQPSPPEFADPFEVTSGIQGNTYYNVIYLQGAKDSSGDRPTAEVKADSSVISNDDREISPGVLRDPTIITEAGANFRAQALLDAAQKNGDLIGSKKIPPSDLLPGFSYSVDLGNGKTEKVLEDINLTYGDSLQSTAKFRRETQIAEQINDLKVEAKNIGDKV